MRKILWIILYLPYLAFSQSDYWRSCSEREISNAGTRYIFAQHYQTYALDFSKLKQRLLTAPYEWTTRAEESPLTIELPFPDGTMRSFRVAYSPVLHPDLEKKYPEIRSYAIKGLDDPFATGRIDHTYQGFHAMIQTLDGTVFIDPYANQTTQYYLVYWRHDFVTDKVFQCLVNETYNPDETPTSEKTQSARAVGSLQRKYRLAVCATGEYTQFHGGTTSGALSAINTTVNRVNQVLNRDLCIFFELVPNNDTLIFTSSTSDPFTNGNASQMIDACDATCDSRIGSANYDIGHVFGTAGAGLAGLEVICTSSKGKGVTGISNPVGDPFDIDYVAHEMGHQLAANHTFNNCAGSGSTNAPAYEPGSGVTIMAYAGICNTATNIANNSIDIYHNGSFYEIAGNTLQISGQTGYNCAQKLATTNDPPEITHINGGFYIPISTPFELTAIASDPNGDAITYCWEEIDNGPVSSLSSPSGNAPIFRSWLPSSSPTRTFPRMQELVNNTTPKGERLPTYSRDLKFAITVRDNVTLGGGSDYDTIQFKVTSNAGPFLVNYPNTNVTWQTGSNYTVQWDVASTNLAPVNCQNVNIKLSIDGGFTYPYTLKSNTPNDGSETILVPTNITGLPKTTCRVRVEAADNIFFDISNVNFRIEQGQTTAISEDLTTAERVTLFPNPYQDEFSILVQNHTSSPIQVDILDLTGKTVASFENIQGNTPHTLKTNHLPAGTYFVKILFDNQTVIKRVVKQ